MPLKPMEESEMLFVCVFVYKAEVIYNKLIANFN